MPFAPAPTPETARTEHVPLEPAESTVPPPCRRRGCSARCRCARRRRTSSPPRRHPLPHRRRRPPGSSRRPDAAARSDQPFRPLGPPDRPRLDPSRPQRVLQLLGLGLLAGSIVAYAPYLGTALVGAVVLLLRTASVTRQRHGRRQLVRGRARWYDVPTTTLSTPGYAVLALFGSLALVAVAALVALAIFSLGYLRQPAGRAVDGGGRSRASPPPSGGVRARAGCARWRGPSSRARPAPSSAAGWSSR